MNNIYGGMLDGQRLYEEDQRRQKQWEMEQAARAINLDYNQQALPFQIEALSLANQGTGLNNDLARQINPYKVDAQQIANAGGRLGNQAAALEMGWAQQDRPLKRQALELNNQSSYLNNYGKQIANAEAYASAPLNVYAKQLNNNNNEMINSAKALEMDYERFRDPYRRSALNMDYNNAVMDFNNKVAINPHKLQADIYAQQQQAGNSALGMMDNANKFDLNQVNNAFRQAYATNNYSQLGQSLSQLFDDDVLVQPQQDGKVLVTSEGKQQSFESLDALHKAISMASSQTTKQSEPWQSAGNGYALNRSTGEGRQIYQAPQKQQQVPINTTAIGGLVEQYVGTLGLDMSAADKAMLQSDIQSVATGFMRQGDAPSLAVRKAYDQLAPSLGKDSNWFGLNSLDTYKGGGALDMGKTPVTTSTPVTSNQTVLSAPQAAIDYLKANNTPANRAFFSQKYGYLPR